MKCDEEEYTRLDTLLKKAFLGKEKAEASEHWQRNVMSQIRSLGPLNVKTDYLALFEQFVWRFAPVACVLILLLTVYIINFDFVPDYEMVKLFVEDPIEFSYVPMFGV